MVRAGQSRMILLATYAVAVVAIALAATWLTALARDVFAADFVAGKKPVACDLCMAAWSVAPQALIAAMLACRADGPRAVVASWLAVLLPAAGMTYLLLAWLAGRQPRTAPPLPPIVRQEGTP